jgi:hypothetical protein
MTQPAAIAAEQRGLPQLRGRLLWAYRIAWVTFAAAALATVALALFDGSMQPVVLGLRLMKSAIVGTVAFVLFWRRQRDPVAAILSLAFLCWTITSSFDFTTAALVPMLLDRLRFLLFALALLLFPNGRWAPGWTRGVAVGSSVVFAIGAIEAVGLAPTRLFLPLAILCVLAAIAGLIQRFRTTEDETQQQQLKWVALGLVAGVGLILAARAGAALSGASILFEGMFQLGIVVVALGFLVPLLRYRLFDAEAVISRSAAYALLTAALVATFAGSEALIESFGQRYLGSGIGQVSGAMAAAVAAVLLTPLNDRINRWAEQRFQRDLVQLRTELPELLSEVPADWTPALVGQAALPRIVEAVHATRAAIILKGAAIAAEGVSIGRVDRSTSHFPLQLTLRCSFGGHHGWLLLGPRPDGSSYGKDDAEALEAVLPALRRALLASLERTKARQGDEWILSQCRAAIAAMEKRVAALETVRSLNS